MWGGLRAFSGPSIFTALLCRWRHFARVVFTCSCVKAFLLPAPPPLPPSSLGGSSQGCHGYLHVRLRLFQFTQAPSPHPSIGDGLNRNVKYGSPCQFGSLGIFNQQLISIFTLGLSGWSIQKRRTRLRWKMSSCLVCRFLIFKKCIIRVIRQKNLVHCSTTFYEEIWSFGKDINLFIKVIFHEPRLCGFVLWVIAITDRRALYRKCRGGELFQRSSDRLKTQKTLPGSKKSNQLLFI